MYLPTHFSGSEAGAQELIDRFPFATVTSLDEQGSPCFNHFPLLRRETSGGSWVLEGHMARRNPQWVHFQKGSSAFAIFHGPHAYVSPRWYVSGRDVPTWNYAVVQVRGRVQLIQDFRGLNELLARLTERFEGLGESAWTYELPPDLSDPGALTGAIVGFTMQVESVETKMKMSQNRAVGDRQGVIQGLRSRPDEGSREVSRLMQELENDRS